MIPRLTKRRKLSIRGGPEHRSEHRIEYDRSLRTKKNPPLRRVFFLLRSSRKAFLPAPSVGIDRAPNGERTFFRSFNTLAIS
jgi:hypothetical protein